MFILFWRYVSLADAYFNSLLALQDCFDFRKMCFFNRVALHFPRKECSELVLYLGR